MQGLYTTWIKLRGSKQAAFLNKTLPTPPDSFPPLGKHPTATGSKNSSYMGPEGLRLSTTSVSSKPNYKDLYGDLS